MSEKPFIHAPDEPGYVVAWKYKYEFKTGRYDEVMSYGEAKQRAEQLSEEHPEQTFWPEKAAQPGSANRFFRPEAH